MKVLNLAAPLGWDKSLQGSTGGASEISPAISGRLIETSFPVSSLTNCPESRGPRMAPKASV